jgi:Ca2+-binding RTX toxin-like protein
MTTADINASSTSGASLYGGKAQPPADMQVSGDTAHFYSNYAAYTMSFDAAQGQWTVQAPNGKVQTIHAAVLEFTDLKVDASDPALQQPLQHSVTASGQTWVGNALGTQLGGGAGDDIFTGLGGDDTLYGGKGSDTAVYRGNASDYVVEFDTARGEYTVTDKVAGRDGKDNLYSIEQLKFADGTVAIDSVAKVLPSKPMPVEPDGGIGWGAPMPVEPDGGIGTGAHMPTEPTIGFGRIELIDPIVLMDLEMVKDGALAVAFTASTTSDHHLASEALINEPAVEVSLVGLDCGDLSGVLGLAL